VSHLLCEFALRLRSAGLGDETGYELPMTQDQLADTTGLTPVHVNRTLKALEKEGLISRPTPRTLRLPDWRKLTEAGDFDSNYLHMRDDDPAFA
jgi:DNA-binding MarR family transcriptional regulator